MFTNCSRELGHRTAATCGVVTFDTVLTAEEVGFYKPRPETYTAILEKLGVEAEDTGFVAGSPFDVPGAAKVGMEVR